MQAPIPISITSSSYDQYLPTMQPPPRPTPNSGHNQCHSTTQRTAGTLASGFMVSTLPRVPSYPVVPTTYEDAMRRASRQRLSLSKMRTSEGEKVAAAVLPSATKRQPASEKNGSWASTLPYDGPCFRLSTLPSPPCYLQKLQSPLLSLLVGPERKLFQIHKEMLLQAAHYFTTIFNTSINNNDTATFPTDDPTAFELLIQWCYTGKLPSLTLQARDVVFNVEVTKFCSVRLRLCCLADKYGMVLLHNLAVDSIVRFLDSSGDADAGEEREKRAMGLEWKVFKGWCKYVYEHSSENSPLRKFIACYFNYAIRSQGSEDQNPTQTQKSTQNQRKTEEAKSSGYTIPRLHTLANDIPDLTKDLFAFMRQQAFAPRPVSKPWDCNPCDFHIHPSRSSSHFPSSSHSTGKIHIACPMSLVPACSTWPSPTAKIQYFLQDATLRGTVICHVSQLVDNLGLQGYVVVDAVGDLVDGDVARWVEFGRSFRLAMPKIGEEEERGERAREVEKGKEKFVIPEVRIFEPEEEEDLYSADAGL
ncbi:hypothetical protein BKA65DRAFT_599518 [Rhexocercosporidium sp. MPI-PUGE-AT-0058]|nr:hypothetical protein BKA65DRAFT_599518 [Rhexocercosporidium sp. MPI-PUGE-AT-0058]